MKKKYTAKHLKNQKQITDKKLAAKKIVAMLPKIPWNMKLTPLELNNLY